MRVHPGTDGAVADLLVRSGRFFNRSGVSADLRTVRKSGGREGDVFYRDRWSHDKVVRSIHGVNCTAVALAKLFGPAEVDWALGYAAVHARFAEADLPSILNHHASGGAAGQAHRAGEDRSLTQDTAGWAAPGQHPHPPVTDSDAEEVA